MHGSPCLQCPLIHILNSKVHGQHNTYVHIVAQRTNGRAGLKLTSLWAEKQSRSGVIVQDEHKYTH